MPAKGFVATALLNSSQFQLLPSDLFIAQMEVTSPLKRSLKTPKKVTRKNLVDDYFWCFVGP